MIELSRVLSRRNSPGMASSPFLRAAMGRLQLRADQSRDSMTGEFAQLSRSAVSIVMLAPATRETQVHSLAFSAFP